MLKLRLIKQAMRQGGFSRSAVSEGELLVAGGGVMGLEVAVAAGEVGVRARVRDAEGTCFDVEARVLTGTATMRAEGECSCARGHGCRHVAAALVALTLKRSVAVGPAVHPELTHWAATLKGEAALGGESGVMVCYFLSSARVGMVLQLSVRVVLVERGRNGELSQGRDFVPGYGGVERSQVEPAVAADAALLRQLFGQGGFTNSVGLSGKFGAEILAQIVGTGRAYWNRMSGRALELGEGRMAAPVWRELADGSQRAQFLVDPPATEIFALDPPWYYDKGARRCGPLVVAGRRAVAARWLFAPLIPAEQASMMAKSLHRLALPAPQALEVVEKRDLQPTPVLRLERVTFKRPITSFNPHAWNRVTHTHRDIARLRFAYEGHQVAAGEAARRLTVRRGAGVLYLHRNFPAEKRLREALGETGLLPTESFFFTDFPTQLQQSYSLSTEKDWMRFIGEIMPQAREQGWIVEIDPSFPFRPAEVEEWYSQTDAPGSGEDWFSYELGIIVEGQRVNLLPFLPAILPFFKSAEAANPKLEAVSFTLPDGRIVRLPSVRLRAIAATLAEIFDPDAMSHNRLRVSRLRAAELVDLQDGTPWRGPEELRTLAGQLQSFAGITPMAAPDNLVATLRSYQLEGLAWLQFLREHHFGGILADDMGLGKTLQVLAHLVREKNEGRAAGPSLVVAPTSLMAHWRAQAGRFAPGLRTLVLHGGGRKEHFEQIPDHDLVVTSYALLPRDQETLSRHGFHLLILDEAQYIKNPRTKAAEILRSLTAAHRLCMTGTPMENHLGELWSLMHFLAPGYLGSEKQFRKIYRDPIEKAGDKDRRSALARRIRPFILRRRKEDVAKELPPKTEIIRAVELDGDQRDLYETIRLAMQEKVRMEVEKKGLSRSHIIILDALLKLRQVCCDPRLVKLERASKVKNSAKLELLAEMLPAMVAEGRRILLFSQFTSMLDIIERELDRLEIPFVRLDGSTSDRETPVNDFQAGEVPLFLISLKAGGTGLNLTAADTVIHYDPWWNPAVERQATDRAHRIGQDKPVFVYKLVTTGTVEEKILAMQERKKELVAGLLGEGAQQNLQLSKEDLEHLLTPVT